MSVCPFICSLARRGACRHKWSNVPCFQCLLPQPSAPPWLASTEHRPQGMILTLWIPSVSSCLHVGSVLFRMIRWYGVMRWKEILTLHCRRWCAVVLNTVLLRMLSFTLVIIVLLNGKVEVLIPGVQNPMHQPDPLLGLRRYINLLLTYLLT